MPDISAESVIGVIPNLSRKKGLFGMESINLFISETRFIFAQLTGDMIKQAAAEARQAPKDGRSTIGRIWDVATIGFRVYEKSMGLTPEEILRQHPGNFAVGNQDVKSARIVNTSDDDRNYTRLVIATNTRGTLTLTMQSANIGAVRDILRRVLGNRFR